MESLTDKEFIDFLDSFNSKYCDTVTNISRSQPNDENELGVPLVVNDKFRMLSLDDMKDECPRIIDKPKSMDGIFYYLKSKGDNEKLILYLVEFKRTRHNEYNYKELLGNIIDEMKEDNLEVENRNKLTNNNNKKLPYKKDLIENLGEIYKKYDDKIENSLKQKPLESITMVLPDLYDEYSNDDGKDIEGFLKDCDIRVIVFLDKHTQNLKINTSDESDIKKSNGMNLTEKLKQKDDVKKSKNNESHNKAFLRSSRVQQYYNKLKRRGFISDSSFYSSNEFDLFLQTEKFMKLPEEILNSNLVIDDLDSFFN